MDVLTIQSDEVALQAIKENTRPRYLKLWKDFKEFTGDESLDTRVPSEDEILNFVRHLRDDKSIFNCIFNICSICNICYIIGMASSTMWTCYSQLNGLIKSKYGFNLKKYACVTYS